MNRYVNVSPQLTVKLTWSEAMDASTLTSANVKLITGWTGQTVPAVLSYNSLLNRLDIIPLAPLVEDTAYIVRVSSEVKSLAGANFEQSGDWELHFRTKAASQGTGGSTGGGTVGGDGSGGQPGNPPGSGNPGPGDRAVVVAVVAVVAVVEAAVLAAIRIPVARGIPSRVMSTR